MVMATFNFEERLFEYLMGEFLLSEEKSFWFFVLVDNMRSIAQVPSAYSRRLCHACSVVSQNKILASRKS